MTANPQRSGCPICEKPLTGLARLAQLSTTTRLDRFTTDPPGPLPDHTIGIDWLALPCWHSLTSQNEVWNAAVALGWGEETADAINAPLPRRVAA